MVGYSKLNRWIEARASSVPSGKGKEPPGEKGETAEVAEVSCAPAAGPSENICRTVTFRGVLSFGVFRVILPVAVNVEFLRIRGFFVERTERK